MAIKPNVKVWWCLCFNVLILLAVSILSVVFRDPQSTYFKVGPQPSLVVVSVLIDTWAKWGVLVSLISLIRICEVFVHEIGFPILGFRVYNPDKTEIDDFSKLELNILANSMSMVTGVRRVLMMLVSISQVDIAMISLLFSEIASIFTVRILLNEKKFINPKVVTDTDTDLISLV